MSKGQFCENCIHRIVCDHESKYRKACSQFLEARPQGKWLILYECPNCGEIRNTPFEVCPQCKAHMREGDKNDL